MRLAALPVRMITVSVPMLIPLLETFSTHFMSTRHSAISFAAYAACCHQEREDPIGGDNTSALGQTC